MYEEHHFTRDAAIVQFKDADGVDVEEGEPTINWDEVEVVSVEQPPHAEAFDSKDFYKLPATVAKPIPQPYQYGQDTVWLKKPREELKKSAWSLDNAPWTMGHPNTGMVKDVDDVRGFWKNPRYIDSLDDLDADLHIPVNDEEAKKHIEENSDVSVGFYNRIARTDEYSGVVGGEDSDYTEVEGYQTDMLFDHCASVGVGRCPGSSGCGIDSGPHGHVSVVDSDPFKSGTRTTDISDEADETMEDATDAHGTHDGSWYAVGPSETSDDEWKFPIDNCADATDAWNLRNSGDISISVETLEERIKERASDLDCDLPSTADQDAIQASKDRYDIVSDCGCEDTQSDMQIEFDDLSTEAALSKLEEQHDGAASRLEELREAEDAIEQYKDDAETAEEAAEELELDSVEDLSDAVSMLKDRAEELEDELEEIQRPQMEEDAEFIAERTDRFGEDAEEVVENLDADPETVADKRELVEELTESYDEATANSGGSESTTEVEAAGKYAKTPW